jgi:hypothetical protein
MDIVQLLDLIGQNEGNERGVVLQHPCFFVVDHVEDVVDQLSG